MKTSSKKIGLFSAIICLSFTSATLAQRHEGPRSENRMENRDHKKPSFDHLLEKMDANKNGQIEKSEAKGPLTNHFDKIDTDKNGSITKIEFEKAPKNKGKRPSFSHLLEKMDEDKNGTIEKSEAKGPIAHHFDKIDTDKNGSITKIEFEKAPKHKGKRPSFSHLLEKMDGNQDGIIQKKEAKGRLSENFDRIDANNDGMITKEEFAKKPRKQCKGKDAKCCDKSQKKCAKK
jgi:Ca2+-binding EF-hand superfamily protein